MGFLVIFGSKNVQNLVDLTMMVWQLPIYKVIVQHFWGALQ